jgi:three-Cys-motif partner protein
MKGESTRIKLEPHSEAKIELICKYLAKQFNILKRAPHYDTVSIYDLFCGEGKYGDGKFGSPVKIIETLYNHSSSKVNQNNKGKLNFNFYFNDTGMSAIEKEFKKTDRVKKIITEKFPNYHDKCKISYDDLDANDYMKRINDSLRSEIRTIILDPWGYTQFDYNILKRVTNRNTELIIFIPVSNIWRFLKSTMNDESSFNVEAIKQFINILWGQSTPESKNLDDFFIELANKIKEYLGYEYNNFFQFTPKNIGQKYGLFLFSNNYRGYTKMLESMWEIDTENGKGFQTKSNNTGSLFSPIYLSNFKSRLDKYLKENPGITNEQLRKYINVNLKHRPKHANEVMKELLKNGLQVTALDNKDIRTNNTYISNEERRVRYDYV